LVDPCFDVVEADWVGDGEGEDDAVCALIERFGDVAETLLAGRVPDVKGDLVGLQFHPLYLEIHADGAEVVGLEGVLAVADQDARLAHSAIPNDQVLEGDISGCAHDYYLQNLKWAFKLRMARVPIVLFLPLSSLPYF
jgi:hypothetical protein